MPTQSDLFNVASFAEGMARQLIVAAHLSLHGAPKLSQEHTDNATDYLHRVADIMGYTLTPKAQPVQPAATAEAYGPADYAASVGGM